MFTGIVQGCFEVAKVEKKSGLTRIGVSFSKHLLKNLKVGSSISVDGVCLTVTRIDRNLISFDMMGETLKRTTMGSVKENQKVNIERSISRYDEIGGHIVSGHVDSIAKIIKVEKPDENNHVVAFKTDKEWIKYIFSKGFISLDGVSLTVVDVDRKENTFTVWLIPKTLELTTFGFKGEGDAVNLEIERYTRVLVDTITNSLEAYFGKRL